MVIPPILQPPTPNIFTAKWGHTDICELLILAGARVDCVDREGRSPIDYATSAGQDSALRMLVEKPYEIAQAYINAEEKKQR